MTTNDPIKADAPQNMGALSGSTSLRSPEPSSVVSAHPGNDPARRERPSQHGAMLGQALSDLAKAGAVGTGLLDLMCPTCAFREGCMTNQMAATGSEALKCLTGEDEADFCCHYGMKNGQPSRLCAGFVAAQRAPFDVFKNTLRTLSDRLTLLPAHDAERAAFDAWAAIHDPDGTMDDYERSRRYSKAIAMEAGRQERE